MPPPGAYQLTFFWIRVLFFNKIAEKIILVPGRPHPALVIFTVSVVMIIILGSATTLIHYPGGLMLAAVFNIMWRLVIPIDYDYS